MSDKDKKQGEGQAPVKAKILHHRSPHFSSHFATNTVVAGPTGDGMYHLIFNADAMSVPHETAELLSTDGEVTEDGYIKAEYKTIIKHDDLEYFREDKARITLSRESVIRLRDVLIKLFPLDDQGNP